MIRALSDTLVDRGRTLTRLEGAEQQLVLLETGRGLDRMIRYIAMLVLSATIATGGVLLDSTATVSGAMIVAPLATPAVCVSMAFVIAGPAVLVPAALRVASVQTVGTTTALPVPPGRLEPGGIPLRPSWRADGPPVAIERAGRMDGARRLHR